MRFDWRLPGVKLVLWVAEEDNWRLWDFKGVVFEVVVVVVVVVGALRRGMVQRGRTLLSEDGCWAFESDTAASS